MMILHISMKIIISTQLNNGIFWSDVLDNTQQSPKHQTREHVLLEQCFFLH